MGRTQIIPKNFWVEPFIQEMKTEEKYFYIYLLTNPNSNHIGIYRITKKEMVFYTNYPLEKVESLIERFTTKYGLIRYNEKTKELAVKNWGRINLKKGGKPVMECIESELQDVIDRSLIHYVADSIKKKDIYNLFLAYCSKSDRESLTVHKAPQTPGDRKETSKLQQQDIKELITFWDNNGFGVSNISGKEQLLKWLDDGDFHEPKEVIKKALSIACANNKRRLNYVEGILKNWQNESLRTMKEIENYLEKQQRKQKSRNDDVPGRVIPSGFVLDITAGERE